jgi:hypothetical protein
MRYCILARLDARLDIDRPRCEVCCRTPTGSQLVYFTVVRLGRWGWSPMVLISHRREFRVESGSIEVRGLRATRLRVAAGLFCYFGMAVAFRLVSWNFSGASFLARVDARCVIDRPRCEVVCFRCICLSVGRIRLGCDVDFGIAGALRLESCGILARGRSLHMATCTMIALV